jgi:aromatic ring-opening dioxygenase catalytic subunit (LigB family)
LSGGFTVHNLGGHESFLPETDSLRYRQFNDAVVSAISVSGVRCLQNCRPYSSVLSHLKPVARRTALISLTQHESFRLAHLREDHFVPVYVVVGAEEGGLHILLSGLFFFDSMDVHPRVQNSM